MDSSAAMDPSARNSDDPVITYVSPYVELNAGIWSLFAGATIFLGLRMWCKVTMRLGLWYDDYILILSWVSAPRAHYLYACLVDQNHEMSCVAKVDRY